jgi:hypothetical protein
VNYSIWNEEELPDCERSQFTLLRTKEVPHPYETRRDKIIITYNLTLEKEFSTTENIILVHMLV